MVSPWLLGTDLGVYMIIYGINYALVCIRPKMAVKFGSQSELTIGDFSGIVTEGFTIPENSIHKIIFVE